MLPLVRAIVKDLADLSREVIERRERLAHCLPAATRNRPTSIAKSCADRGRAGKGRPAAARLRGRAERLGRGAEKRPKGWSIFPRWSTAARRISAGSSASRKCCSGTNWSGLRRSAIADGRCGRGPRGGRRWIEHDFYGPLILSSRRGIVHGAQLAIAPIFSHFGVASLPFR